jgi:ABC-type Mn2+/Zn2+ transport system ATPase subunit
MGYVPQRVALDLSLPLTVAEAIRMPLLGARDADAEGAFRHFTEALGVTHLLDKPLAPIMRRAVKRRRDPCG